MSKTFIGYDGHYELDDEGNIIQRFVNKMGELTGLTKIYKDVKKIPNKLDREAIAHLLQITKISRLFIRS